MPTRLLSKKGWQSYQQQAGCTGEGPGGTGQRDRRDRVDQVDEVRAERTRLPYTAKFQNKRAVRTKSIQAN